jgi:hypothetical protein
MTLKLALIARLLSKSDSKQMRQETSEWTSIVIGRGPHDDSPCKWRYLRRLTDEYSASD